MRSCYIVGAGAFTQRDFDPDPDDLIIAADGGYRALASIGVVPGVLLGDFDSLGEPPRDAPETMTIQRYPAKKDDTDTGIALETGYSKGFRRFLLYGCGGGRVDHLLANMQSMSHYQRLGASMRLVDADYDLYALHNGALTLPPRPANTLVSVFCNGNEACGVTLRGLQYPLTNATLTCDRPLGVSNRYADREAVVSVEKGSLWVMVYTTPDEA